MLSIYFDSYSPYLVTRHYIETCWEFTQGNMVSFELLASEGGAALVHVDSVRMNLLSHRMSIPSVRINLLSHRMSIPFNDHPNMSHASWEFQRNEKVYVRGSEGGRQIYTYWASLRSKKRLNSR